MIYLFMASIASMLALNGPGPWPVNKTHMSQRQAEIKALRDYAFDPAISSRQTTAVLVIRDGQIIFEEYGPTHNQHRRHLVWSISKSITNALVGMAIKDGQLKLADSICDHGFSRNCEVTVESLLHWTSGLEWAETYEESQNMADSDVLNMLYQHHDMAAFAVARNPNAKPGLVWNYSSGDTNILMAILKRIYPLGFSELPWRKLFTPLGISTAVWEQDQQGVFVGSSYVYLSAQDLARFGELYLAEGKIGKTQVWPAGWVDYSRNPSTAVIQQVDNWQRGTIAGAHWWANVPHPSLPVPKPFAELPDDAMMAMGHWGQYLLIVPSQNLLVVRFGATRAETDVVTGEKSFDISRFIKLVMAVAED